MPKQQSEMPRPNKLNGHLQKVRQKASAVLKVPTEVKAGLAAAPPLTLQAPQKLTATRGATPQRCQIDSARSWNYVLYNFSAFQLQHDEGTEANCESDYGGFRAKFSFA